MRGHLDAKSLRYLRLTLDTLNTTLGAGQWETVATSGTDQARPFAIVKYGSGKDHWGTEIKTAPRHH